MMTGIIFVNNVFKIISFLVSAGGVGTLCSLYYELSLCCERSD